ncbi:MAG: hypothetical protein HY257_08725 [Chloroflexi bacterium]|nr:hypothetical protein [Chloroflexota bacterium]
MSPAQKSFLIYLASLLVVVVLLDLHFVASQEGSIPLRFRVERSRAETLRRTYRIALNGARTNTPLSDATVLVITQPRDSNASEITIVATELFKEPGVYLAIVPFSREGDWLVHVALNHPIATHVSFSERIRGTELGAAIPVLEAEAVPIGALTLRTLADGYAFIAHLAATAVLGLALVMLFIASRDPNQTHGEMTMMGTHLFWASNIVLVSTGIYNFVYHTISTAPVPLTLNIAETWRQLSLENYGSVYAAILAAKHLAILALIGIGAALTFAWRAAHSLDSAARARKMRAAVATIAVILGTIILLLGGALVYLHAISEH